MGLFVYSRRSVKGRLCRIVIKHKGKEMHSDSARNLLSSIAKDGGKIRSRLKVAVSGLPGPCWEFWCEGHGGYFMVVPRTDIPDALREFLYEDIGAYWSVLFFEEFSDFQAIFSWYPQVAAWSHKFILELQAENSHGDTEEKFVNLFKATLSDPHALKKECYELYLDSRESVSRWVYRTGFREHMNSVPILSFDEFKM